MLGALSLVTRQARIGPAVTYAFDPAAHHPSWLAKRAVTVDHLSGGRLDLRLAVGAGDAATRAAWERHGIRYPDGRTRVAALEAALDVLDRLLRGETVETSGPFGRCATRAWSHARSSSRALHCGSRRCGRRPWR